MKVTKRVCNQSFTVQNNKINSQNVRRQTNYCYWINNRSLAMYVCVCACVRVCVSVVSNICKYAEIET